MRLAEADKQNTLHLRNTNDKDTCCAPSIKDLAKPLPKSTAEVLLKKY
jgi:hypothetical protein